MEEEEDDEEARRIVAARKGLISSQSRVDRRICEINLLKISLQ